MKDEIFAYLDALHEKADANMWEAPALVAKMFKVNKELARGIVAIWISQQDDFYKRSKWLT